MRSTKYRKILFCFFLVFAGMFYHLCLVELLANKKYSQDWETRLSAYYEGDLLSVKPGREYVLNVDKACLIDSDGSEMGFINNKTVVYLNDTCSRQDQLSKITLLAWIWAQSLNKDLCLATHENIRYRANSHVIGKINQGVCPDTLYSNQLRSWILIKLQALIPYDQLISYEVFQQKSWFYKHFARNTYPTITQRYGGFAVKPFKRPLLSNLNLRWEIRLVLLVITFITVNVIALKTARFPRQHGYHAFLVNLVFQASGFLTGIIIGFI